MKVKNINSFNYENRLLVYTNNSCDLISQSIFPTYLN